MSLAIRVAAAGLLMLALGLSFWPSFATGPAGDDFGTMSPTYAVWPQREMSLADCFVPYHPSRYRPLELVAGVLSDRDGPGFDPLRFRAIALAGLAGLLAVFGWWCRILRLGPTASTLALSLMALHPIHAGVAGGIDTFAGSYIYAIALAAAALIARYPLPWPGVALTAFAATLLASLFKEYGYGAWLVCAAAALTFRARDAASALRHLAASALGGVIAIALLQTIRWTFLPPEVAFVAQSPVGLRTVLYNLLLYVGGSLFAGYTPGVIIDRDPIAIALAAVVALYLSAFLLLALSTFWNDHRLRRHQPPTPDGPAPSDDTQPHALDPRQRLFPLLALPGVMLPNLIAIRTSEVYLSGAVACAMLLVALGLHHLLRRPGRDLFIAGLSLPVLLFMGVSQGMKVRDVRRCGDEARIVAREIASLARQWPPGPDRSAEIVLLARPEQFRPFYSVFRINTFTAANFVTIGPSGEVPAVPTPMHGTDAVRWYDLAPGRTISMSIGRDPHDARKLRWPDRPPLLVEYDLHTRRARALPAPNDPELQPANPSP